MDSPATLPSSGFNFAVSYFMYFLIALFFLSTLIIGANFCVLLIGGLPFRGGKEFAPLKIGDRIYSVERLSVGVSTIVFGVSWLIAWFGFIAISWDSFILQFSTVIFHVVLQLAASLGLIIAGVGIFKQWQNSKGLFLLSMVTMVGSIGVAILLHGPSGHGEPNLMYLFGIWTIVVGGVFTVIIYFIDRFKNNFSLKNSQ